MIENVDPGLSSPANSRILEPPDDLVSLLAPPGYLGHRETVPMLTQQHLVDATSERSDLALVLFDEIEKAAHSMTKLTVCAEKNFPILFKLFLAHDVLNLIRGSYRRSFAAGAGSVGSAESRVQTDSV